MSLTYYFSESTFSAFKKSLLERLQKCIGNSIIPQSSIAPMLFAAGDLKEGQKERALNVICSVSGYVGLYL